MDFDEFGERSVELVVGDLVAVEVELGEDGLVDGSSSLSAERLVERPGGFEELQCLFDDRSAGLQVGGVVGEPSMDAGAIALQFLESFLDLGLGEFAICGEVDEVLFLAVEAGEFGFELLA
ncbi:MAG: hypothetical protein ACK5O2_15655 [Microthrixaceae bacterium]